MSISRVNYFDRQFLKVDEFKDEQAYHLDARRRLTRAFQDWGIVKGLEVRVVDPITVSVSPGLAVDALGREMVVDKEVRVRVPYGEGPKPVYVTIAYKEQLDPDSRSGSAGAPKTETRMRELADFAGSTVMPADDGSCVLLAQFTQDGNRPAGQVLDGGVRRLAGALRLAAGAEAVGAFKVQGPFTLQDAFTANGAVQVKGALQAEGGTTLKALSADATTVDRLTVRNDTTLQGPLAVQGAAALRGHVSVGSAAPDNAESWNRVLEIMGSGNARLTLRSQPDPKSMIDGRIQVHGNGWWGSKPGMIVGTATDHELSFGVRGVVKMSMSTAGGVVVAAPLSVTGPNEASFASNVRVDRDLSAASVKSGGRISSPMWKVTQVFNSATKLEPTPGLPLDSTFDSTGGTLLVFLHGSAYAEKNNVNIGVSLMIDNVFRGASYLGIPDAGTHRHWPLTGNTIVVKDLPAGHHALRLQAATADTRSNGGDWFSVTVLELPF